MMDPKDKIEQALGLQFGNDGYEVELIAIPKNLNPGLMLQTLEDAISEFDMTRNSGFGYLIQVKPRAQITPSIRPVETETTPHLLENIYSTQGTLNLDYLLKNADILLKAKEYVLAKNIYRTILNSGEKSAIALFGLARCYEAEGNTADAILSYEESIAYNPLLETYQRLGTLLIRQQKNEQAGELLERAVQIHGNSRQTKFDLFKAAGNCLIRAERYEKAEYCFKKALELNPRSEAVLANLGFVYVHISKYLDAKRCFQDTLTANAKNDKAWCGLGSCYLHEKNLRQAHDSFAKALEVNLNNPTAIFHLVKCAFDLKSYATAARILAQYIQVAPVNTNLLYSLGGLQFHLGRVHEARETVQKILSLKPDHSGAQELLALTERYVSS